LFVPLPKEKVKIQKFKGFAKETTNTAFEKFWEKEVKDISPWYK
jgi:hypothetical protein